MHRHPLSSSSSSSSLPSLDVSISSSNGGGGVSGQSPLNSMTPTSTGGRVGGSLPRGVTPPASHSPMRTPDFYVIRVSVSTPSKETERINLYKVISICYLPLLSCVYAGVCFIIKILIC